ncbi:MAG: YggS family pyridoxal phosphate-dependent enzyme [Fibrobacter sp.]|jgi:pyridoxal phosphate enzyme (YggS family)|nr:YggS family pyridoxal phosphate-dependent enzyme [Fibrobacter sp.]
MSLSLEEMRVRLKALRARIEAACVECSRSLKSVKIIWVSKFQSKEAVETAILLGAQEFGENRVQEAVEKFGTPRAGIRVHIIGPVQSNKLRKAASVADVIQTVADKETLVKLEAVCAELNKKIDVMFQINTSEEDTKSGIAMNEVSAFFEDLPETPHLCFRGLMTIGKNTGNPEDSRAGFAFLRRTRAALQKRGGVFTDCTELSMGMTDDLEVAIEEGATMIRVGTALFGSRGY